MDDCIYLSTYCVYEVSVLELTPYSKRTLNIQQMLKWWNTDLYGAYPERGWHEAWQFHKSWNIGMVGKTIWKIMSSVSKNTSYFEESFEFLSAPSKSRKFFVEYNQGSLPLWKTFESIFNPTSLIVFTYFP